MKLAPVKIGGVLLVAITANATAGAASDAYAVSADVLDAGRWMPTSA